MEFITEISRYVLPSITVMLLVKCILALWLGHPKEKTYGYITDMHSGQRHALNMWETSIGRAGSCDIVLEYDSVARVQAVISRRIDGWYIFETLARSPIRVNGTAITKKQTISHGDILTMGKIRFRFEIADDPVQRVGRHKKKQQEKSGKVSAGATKRQSPAARQGAVQRPQPPKTVRRSSADTFTVETPRTGKNVRRITQCCLVNKDSGEIFILCGNEVKIGSGRRCDIKLRSNNVAKVHALVVLYEDGWAIEDNASGKATLLNGKKVTAPQLLFDGDIISMADERLYYVVKTKTIG